MEHLIPTLLGIAGALAPVALEYWRLERRQTPSPHRASMYRSRAGEPDQGDTVVRGGRVYLCS